MIFAFSYQLMTWVYCLLWSAPANVIIRYIRKPRGMKWALPLSVVMAPVYCGAMVVAVTFAERGHAWLYFVGVMFGFSMVKFAAAIFISPLWMLAHWWRCRYARPEGFEHVHSSQKDRRQVWPGEAR